MSQPHSGSRIRSVQEYSALGWLTHAPLKHPTTEIPIDIVTAHFAGLAVYVYVPKEICSTSIQIHPQPRSFPGMSFIAYIEVKIPKPSSVESAISIIILNYNARHPTYPLPTSTSLYTLFTMTQTPQKKVMEELKPHFQLLTKTNNVFLVPKRDTQIVKPKFDYISRGHSLQHRVYYVFRVPPVSIQGTGGIGGGTIASTPPFPEFPYSSYHTSSSFSTSSSSSSAFSSFASGLSSLDSSDLDVEEQINVFDPNTFVDNEGKKMCVMIRTSPDLFLGLLLKIAGELMDVNVAKHSIRLFTHPEQDLDFFYTLFQVNRRRFLIVPKEGRPDVTYFLSLLSALSTSDVSSPSIAPTSLPSSAPVPTPPSLDRFPPEHLRAMQVLQRDYTCDADEILMDEELDDICIVDNCSFEGGFSQPPSVLSSSSSSHSSAGDRSDRDPAPHHLRLPHNRLRRFGPGMTYPRDGMPHPEFDGTRDDIPGGGRDRDKTMGHPMSPQHSDPSSGVGILKGGWFAAGVGMFCDSVSPIEVNDEDDDWMVTAGQDDLAIPVEGVGARPEAEPEGSALVAEGERTGKEEEKQGEGDEDGDDEYEYVTDEEDDEDEYEEYEEEEYAEGEEEAEES